jgi:hypothetical protein
MENGGWRMENGEWRIEIGDWRLEIVWVTGFGWHGDMIA